MRRTIGVTLLVVFGLLQAPASFAESRTLDKRISRAWNIALGFDTGFEFTSTAPSSEDQDALFRIRKQLDSWGRFFIVSPERADMLIAIRVRAPFSSGGGLRGGVDLQVDGVGFQGVGDSRVDTLSIYDARMRQVSGRLWRVERLGGLSGDQSLLVDILRNEIEKAGR